MGLYRSLGGSIRLRVTSGDIGGLLNKLIEVNVPIHSVQLEGELDISFTVERKNLPQIRRICTGRGDILKIRRKEGLYWLAYGLIRRPVLLVGMGLLLFWMLWVPSHIFFIRVEGNETVPSRQIIASAEECGICFGATRRQVRSEQVKNALLETLPQLKWAGVNTYGCVAVISVREKNLTETEPEDNGVGSIVSSCDAIVRSATATRGNLLCRVGQAVRTGQTLISGYTDCGLTIQATNASGEIYGWTQHDVTVICPTDSLFRGEATERSTAYSIIFGKNRINLWKGSGISGTTCDRIYTEYTLTLPGGFTLPVTLVKETFTDYETESVEHVCAEAMAEFARQYLLSQLIAAKVENCEEDFAVVDGVGIMQVRFHCTEMIGRQKAEEIGDLHG